LALFDQSAFGKPDIRGTGASVLQAQQAIGAATPAGAPPVKANDIAAAVTKSQTAQLGQNIQTGMAKADVSNKTNIIKTTTQQRIDMTRKRGDTQRSLMQARLDLSNTGRDVEKKLLQDRMEFEADERGLKFSNMRQFADFKRMVAKDDEEFQNYSQEVANKSAKKSKLLAVARAKIDMALKQDSASTINRLDNEQRARLAKAAIDAKKQQQEHLARAKNISLVFTAVGMVAGGVIGGMAGGVGAVPGAAMGASAGSAVGSGVNMAIDNSEK